MRPPAITTRFAHPEILAPTTIVERVVSAGASGIVLDERLDRERLEILTLELERRRESLPVVAVELPAGPCLVSVDRDEARLARDLARGAIRRAAALGSARVVLRLGAIHALSDGWKAIRDRFLRGRLDAKTARQAAQARDGSALPHLDVARATLDELCREAEDEGVTLCLANRRRYTELPSAREMTLLSTELSGAPLSPCLDVAAAHLLDVMQLEPMALTLATFGSGTLAYVGDACGPVGALPPGRGIVDLGALLGQLPQGGADIRVFDPWSGLSTAEIAEAVGHQGLAVPAIS